MAALKAIWQWLSGIVGNNPKTRYLIFLFIILLIVTTRACYHGAKADELHLEFGSTVLHGVGPYLGLYYRFDRPHAIDIETGLQLWGASRYNGDDIPNNWAVSALVDIHSYNFNIGIGVARLQLTDPLDGSKTNISLKMGYQFADRWEVDIRHLSNAGTTEHNIGRNAVLLDWRLR